MKVCVACEQSKDPSEFYKATKRKDGLTSLCKPCSTLAGIAWRTENLEKYKDYTRQHYAKNRDRYRAKAKARYVGNPDQRRGYQLTAYWPELNWKEALEKFRGMITVQDNRCAICRKECELCVDHNHSTGEVRELLCNNCNLAVGYVKDDAEVAARLAEYLKKFA